MSEFLAEASVLIKPDTTRFRKDLEKALAAATRQVSTVKVPVTIAAVSGDLAGAAAAAAGATAGLATAQQAAQKSALGLSSSEAALEKAYGAQATILPGLSAATLQQAGATTTLDAANKGAVLSSEKLDAALLGLRTIAGSAAVIGLGALSLAAIAAGKAIRASIGSAASLEQELNVFRVTAEATAAQMKVVGEEAQALGEDITLPAVTATDAVKAFTELAKAGLSVQDALAGGRGVLELSAAAQISFSSAAELTANALNAFQLSGVQAVHIADLLANASNAAQGSVEDMGLALQQAASVANQLGLDVETTVAFITELARAGIQGSDAGTSLRVALTRLIAPTAKAQKVIEDLHISLRDIQGNLRPDVFVQLGRAMEGLGKQDQARLLFQIFGQDAQRAAAILARDTLPVLNETIAALDKQGSAAELAGARNVGFAGKMSALSSAAQTLGTSLGQLATGPLGDAAQGLVTITNDTTALIENIKRLNEESSKPFGDGGGLSQLLTLNFSDFQDQISSTVQLIREGGFGKALNTSEVSAAKALRDFRRETEQTNESVASTRTKIDGLFDSFVKAGGRGSAPALNEFVLGLQKLSEAQRTGLVTNSQFASSIEALIKSLQTGDFNVDVGVQLDKSGLRTTAQDGAGIVLNTITGVLSPEAGKAIGFGFMGGVGDGITEGSKKASAAAATAGDVLARDIAVAQAGGNEGQLLSLLREREANQQAFLERILARPQNKKNVELATKAADNLDATRKQIQTILDGEAADTQAAANEAKTARDKTDQALLDMFGAREQGAQNAIVRAQGTKTLKDDLAAQKALLVILTNKLVAIQNTVKNAKTRAAQIAAVTAEMIQVGQEIKKINQAQADAIAQAQEAARARAQESVELDIDLAHTTGNVQAEIAGRRRLITLLKKQQGLVKKGTLEWKHLRNRIAEETAAINDLQGEKKKQGEAQGAFFNFLQTQQGFAANLLGNLIPGFATSGLVGGSSAASGAAAGDPFAFTPNAAEINTGVGGSAAVAAGKGATVRPVQVDTTNSLLRQILAALRSRPGHPEAAHQRQTATASYYGPDHGF